MVVRGRTWAGRRSLVALSLLLAACSAEKRATDREPAAPDRLANLAANSTFSVVDTGEEPLVAIQLRITDAGASVVRTEFVSAPRPTGSGEQDLVVMGLAGSEVAHKYAIADPLQAEVETEDRGLHKTVRLPEALLWIYMPAVQLDSVELAPTRESDVQSFSGRGVRIDMRPVLRRMCGGDAVSTCARRAVASDQGVAPSEPDRP